MGEERTDVFLNNDGSMVIIENGDHIRYLTATEAVELGLDLLECGMQAVCTDEQREESLAMLRESSIFEHETRILEGNARILSDMQKEIVRDRRALMIWSGILIFAGVILSFGWIDLASKLLEKK